MLSATRRLSGQFAFTSSLFPRHRAYPDRDLLPQILEAARPGGAHVVPYVQIGGHLTELGGSVALHLLNHTGNMYETSTPANWAAPLTGLEFTLRHPDGKRLRRAVAVTSGKPVALTTCSDSCRVRISLPGVYECLLLSYE